MQTTTTPPPKKMTNPYQNRIEGGEEKGSSDKIPLGRLLRNPCHQLQTPLPELERPLCRETGEDFAGDPPMGSR